nr:ATPase domain-containing protein [Candidatus Njordarchaeota archaeon]
METVGSGIPELDKLLGGGLVKGKAYLLESVTGAKPRFLVSAFCRRGYLNGELCEIDSFDYSFSEVLEDLKNSGFDASKAAAQGKLLILDFMNDVIYGSKVSGPYLSTSSHGIDMKQFENLRNVALEEVTKLKGNVNGLRVVVHSLSSLIRNFGLQDALKFAISQAIFLKRQSGVLVSTLNPDTVNATDLAIIEETFDGIIELTIKEEKLKFQRYIRVKDSPIPSFRQERLPYEIIEGQGAVSIASKITEDFESFKANIKMLKPGVIDILGSRNFIQTAEGTTFLHRLLFHKIGYEEGWNLLYQMGVESVQSFLTPFFDKLKIDASELTTSPLTVMDSISKFASLRGYGVLKLARFDERSGKVYVRLSDSPAGLDLLDYGKPVDAFMAGAIAGAARIFMRTSVVCRETSCVAKGDEYCEFEVSQE